MRLPTLFRSSASALLLIAAVTVAQSLLCSSIVAEQRDSAHIIQVSGAQRMRTERIAYLVATAHAGRPEPGWQTLLETTIADMLEVRNQIVTDKRYALKERDPAAGAAFTEDDRYIAAARSLERDTTDRRAFQTIRDLRPRLLVAFDTSVKLRSRLIVARNEALAAALFAGLAVQLATIAAVWLRMIRPAERRVRTSLARISEQRSELLSLFDQNPDPIAVYDCEGRLQQVNAARVGLLGIPEAELLGRHFTSFMSPDTVADARAAFARALAGEDVIEEVRFTTSDGETIDASSRLSPKRVAGEVIGVIAVSRNVSELRRAQNLNEQMSQRLAALYEISSDRNVHWRRQVADALTLAAGQLHYEWGIVTEVAGDDVHILAIVGEPIALLPRAPVTLDDSLSQFIVSSNDVFVIDDLLDPRWCEYTWPLVTGWRSILAMKLCVEGATYGTLILAGAKPRTQALASADSDFLKIAAELLSTIIERGRRDARLDSLAFFDSLTGLPNRILLREKLDDLIATSGPSAEFAVHFLDLNRFKEVNDSAGHAAGDEVLRIAASRFAHCIRATDIIARLGGDEFVILQPNSDGRSGAVELVARIAEAIAEPFEINGQTFVLGCSVGTALFPDDGTDAQTLLRQADAAMYLVKRGCNTQPEHAA